VASPLHFVDSNVPMYAVGEEHPLKQPCVALLGAVASGRIRAVTNVEVHQELLHRYSALGQRARAVEVAREFLTVVPAVLPVTLDDVELAMELHTAYPTLPTRDIVHVAVMQRHGVEHIISADAHFDAVPTLHRVDPATWTPPPQPAATSGDVSPDAED
jgi:predicted nucleic acid-binding protein